MKLYHKNPRQITDKQFTDLGGSLSRLGDLGGIVHDLNSDEIIGGNQRSRVFDVNKCEIELIEQYAEPDEQGTVGIGFVVWKGKKYAYRQVRWTPKQCEEANIRANKNGGSWDFDTLANEFELDDLLEWGFDKKELDLDLWAGEPKDDPGAQIDKAEELREKWGVESGQLWRLGEHRLICGDCTDRATVEKVMGGERAGAVVTDPPYNVGIDYGSETNESREDYPEWCDKWFSVIRSFADTILFTPGIANLSLWMKYSPRWIIAWVKDNSMRRITIGFNCWEPVLLWGNGKPKVYRDVITASIIPHKDIDHPTPKPIDLFEQIIDGYTDGDILEPFLGSGTTIIACERLGRKCRAVEISPAYCAVAIQRWVDMTGGTPELIEQLEIQVDSR